LPIFRVVNIFENDTLAGRVGRLMEVNTATAWAPYGYAARWRCLPRTDKGTRASFARVIYKKRPL